MTYRTADPDIKRDFHNATGCQIEKWPEDTWDALLTLWVIYNMKPSSRKKAFWINGIRDLLEACGEFGLEILEEVHREWRAKFKKGIAPYTVASPGSLVEVARAKAAEKRSGSHERGCGCETCRVKYTQGKYAEFIKH